MALRVPNLTRNRRRIGDTRFDFFFDRNTILQHISAAERRALSRAGAFTRGAARRSIRKRKGTSQPGRPPHSHEGLLRAFIFFAYEPRTGSVIVGPTKLNERSGYIVPQTLEFGGTVTKRIFEDSGRRRPKQGREVKRITMRFRPRPFMRPALQVGAKRFPQFFKDAM